MARLFAAMTVSLTLMGCSCLDPGVFAILRSCALPLRREAEQARGGQTPSRRGPPRLHKAASGMIGGSKKDVLDLVRQST